MIKHNHYTFPCWIAILSLLMLGAAHGLWAAPTPDPFVKGWKAYDAGRIDDALKIWTPLAEQGNVEAQVNLGIIYDTGQGVTEDPKKAARWYGAAAKLGNRDAQYSLGMMYSMGRGVPRDQSLAAHAFHEAAKQDLPMAQYELGLLFGKGLSPHKHPWEPINALAPVQEQASAQTGKKSNTHIASAIKWFYKSGVTYLALGDSKGAWQALEAIRGHSKDDPLKEVLQNEIIACQLRPRRDHLSPSYADASIGTAWPIASGYVVTNNHVVEDSKNVMLITESGQEIAAWTVLRDEVNDLALLEVDDATALPPAIPLSGSQADEGASVFTVGYPRIDEMGRDPKQSQGVISKLHGIKDDPLSYQTTVPIQPGNSGGPLINMRGEAVGVIKAMIGLRGEAEGDIEPLPNASCALKIECVKDLARLLPQQEPQLGELPPSDDNLVALTQRVKGSVLIVVAR